MKSINRIRNTPNLVIQFIEVTVTIIVVSFVLLIVAIYEEVTENPLIVAGVCTVICTALWLFNVPTWVLLTATIFSFFFWFFFILGSDKD